jgi:hypothetical protein
MSNPFFRLTINLIAHQLVSTSAGFLFQIESRILRLLIEKITAIFH